MGSIGNSTATEWPVIWVNLKYERHFMAASASIDYSRRLERYDSLQRFAIAEHHDRGLLCNSWRAKNQEVV